MMDLVRWNPWKEMADFRSPLSRFFDAPLFRSDWWGEDGDLAAWHPAVDIYEEDDKLMIKAELPGMEKKDISLELKNGVLTLRGERTR